MKTIKDIALLAAGFAAGCFIFAAIASAVTGPPDPHNEPMPRAYSRAMDAWEAGDRASCSDVIRTGDSIIHAREQLNGYLPDNWFIALNTFEHQLNTKGCRPTAYAWLRTLGS